MQIVTTSNYKPAITAQAADTLLSTPTARMIHKIPAQMSVMKSRAGTVQRNVRINNFPLATVEIGNSGQNPAPIIATKINIDVKPQLYGQFMYVNEQVVLQNEEDVIHNYAIRFGVSMRLSEDRLMRDLLASSASALNCVGGTNGDSPTEITAADCIDAETTLASADALTVLDSIEGENRYATAPIPNSYFCLSHTSIIRDLMAIGAADFVRTIRYPSQTNILKSEQGSVGRLRFLTSSQGSLTLASSKLGRTVLNNFFVGIEAIACIYVNELSSEFIYLPKEFSGGLCQNVVLGMKFFEAPAIYNDLWVGNLKSTPSR
jgi:N4-gp56 family major capsid protein